MYSVVIIPYRIGFDRTVIQMSFEDLFDWFCDTMFFIDIVLNFNTPFYDKNGFLVISRKAIARNYVRGFFAIDLVSTIPFDKLLQNVGRETKLIRVVRLFRLAKLVKLLNLSILLDELSEVGISAR